MAFVHAGDYLGEVVLYPGRSAQGTGLATGQIGREILFRQGNSGQHAVNGDADTRPVGLTENTDSEPVTKCIHNFIF